MPFKTLFILAASIRVPIGVSFAVTPLIFPIASKAAATSLLTLVPELPPTGTIVISAVINIDAISILQLIKFNQVRFT